MYIEFQITQSILNFRSRNVYQISDHAMNIKLSVTQFILNCAIYSTGERSGTGYPTVPLSGEGVPHGEGELGKVGKALNRS